MTTLAPITSSLAALGDGSAVPGASAADTSAASTYTDINALAALKRDPNSAQSINAVAEQVEALFLQMMLKSMRDASSAEETDSNEMGMYQDMFDKQVALSISQHTDLGIGRLLKRQLSGKPAPAAAAADKTPTALPVSGKSTLAPTAAEFVNRMLPPIRRAANSLGLNPMGMLAQAALETGWGQRMPRTAAGNSSLNLFGVKAGSEWSGARAVADTVEISGGVAKQSRTAFRAYGSIEESVGDFARLLASSPRYREAIGAGADARAYVQNIAKAGYATDPEYGNKLNEVLSSGTLQAALGARPVKL